MNLSRLGRGEFLAVLGGLLLALGLFLPWYETNPDNRNANDRRRARVASAAGRRIPILRWLLLAAARRAADPRVDHRCATTSCPGRAVR